MKYYTLKVDINMEVVGKSPQCTLKDYKVNRPESVWKIPLNKPIDREIDFTGFYVPNEFYGAYEVVVKAATMGVEIETGNAMVNDLVGAKGMVGMLNTVWLILCAMVFGGALEATGMLKTISNFIIGKVESFFSLIASTVGTCLFFNVTASDQYLAVVVPGRMFQSEYEKRGLAPENLSRTLEDSGTVTSVLVPWNTCGAYHAGLFGVATWAYLPYCFFNLISPIMTLLFAALMIKIKKKITK